MGMVTAITTRSGRPGRTAMIDAAASLHRLLTWTSPAFPIGGYTYSHGLEWLVEAGRVTDAETLFAFVADVLQVGNGRIDAAILVWAYRMVGDRHAEGLVAALDTGLALRGTPEQALESEAQGRAFWETVQALEPVRDRLAWVGDQLPAAGARVPHAWAVGCAGGAMAMPLDPLLNGFLHALAANLISAGVRLIPLGQTAGQQVLARLTPVATTTAAAAQTSDPDDLGAAAPMIDLASMAHETQYTRLFRS